MPYIIVSGEKELVYLQSESKFIQGLGDVPMWTFQKSEAMEFKTKLQADFVKRAVSKMKSTKVIKKA